MMPGLTLTDLARTITAQREMKHDLIADSRQTSVRADADGTLMLDVEDQGSFPMLPLAHRQLGSALKVPALYWDRCRQEAPGLLAVNANYWLAGDESRRMIRTLGGDARAVLSDRYCRIENEEIFEAVMPVLAEVPDMQIVSAQVTETRMYLHAVFPKIEAEIKKGDVVQSGVVISNSEVGCGAVSVQPWVYRLVCLNGLKVVDRSYRAFHVGRRVVDTDQLAVMWADDTRAADDRAVLLKVRDSVKACLDQARFAATVQRMTQLAGTAPAKNPVAAVDVLSKKLGFTLDERGSLLTSLVQGGDLSAWGLVNAVTHQAHSAKSYDRAVEMEEAGGALLHFSNTDWIEVLEAVA